MYLSKGHMIYTAAMAAFQLLISAPMLLILAIMLIADPFYFLEDADGFLPFLMEFGFIACLGIMNIRNFVHASKFNRIFESSGFGAVTTTQAAQKLDISGEVCRKRFDRLTCSGLLKHCHFECENDARFVLHKKQTDDYRGIMTILLQVIAFFGIGLSGFMLFLFIFGVLSDLISGNQDFLDEPEAIILIIILFGAMMAGCLKLRNLIGRAYRFSNYFSGNAGRAVPAIQIARAYVMTAEDAAKEFTKLTRWGLLTGWSVRKTPVLQFIPHGMIITPLENFEPQSAEIQSAAEYAAVNCPNCGASLSLEVGKVEQCPYCDSWLQADGS